MPTPAGAAAADPWAQYAETAPKGVNTAVPGVQPSTPTDKWSQFATGPATPRFSATKDLQPSTPGVPVGVEETAGQMPNNPFSKDYWLGDPNRPAMPSVLGGLKNDVSSLATMGKDVALGFALPATHPLRMQSSLAAGNPLESAATAVQDPLGAAYEMGPFTAASMVAGGAEAVSGAAQGLRSAPTRARTTRALTSLPEAPGTSLEAGTKLAERSARAPEAARQRGVQSYNRIKEGPLGSTFVPDVPESPATAKLRLSRERIKREPRPVTYTAQSAADLTDEAAWNAKRAEFGLEPQYTTKPSGKGGLGDISPEQWAAQGKVSPSAISHDIEDLPRNPGDTSFDITPDSGIEAAKRPTGTDATLGSIRKAGQPFSPPAAAGAAKPTANYRPHVPPSYQAELGRIGSAPDPLPTPPKGQSLASALDEKSNIGRRETGIAGPRLSTKELAQAHKVAETKLIRAVQNSGQDASPLIRAREQYAEAKQLGRQTAPVRSQPAGNLVEMFSDPSKLATAAKKVKVYEPGKAPRVQSTADWYKAMHNAAPEELDGVMRHAEARIIENAVDPRAKTVNGPQLQKVLKAYEDQGLRLPHHDQIAKLAETATSKNYANAPRLLKSLAASLTREGLKGAGAGGAGYALYHWMSR